MGTSLPTVTTVEQRLEGLEKQVAELKNKPKNAWDKFQILAQALTPVVVFCLGYYLIEAVKAGIEQRRLSLENAKEMRELLLDLGKSDTADKAEAAAVSLSAFGSYSINPLIVQLDEDEIRRQAAEKGLRAAWRSVPIETCVQLAKVIENRSGLHRWDTHSAAIQLLGDLTCDSAVPALKAYSELLDRNMPPKSTAEYLRIVRPDASPTTADLMSLHDVLQVAVNKITEYKKDRSRASSVVGGDR
jgi:hypothetical protein